MSEECERDIVPVIRRLVDEVLEACDLCCLNHVALHMFMHGVRIGTEDPKVGSKLWRHFEATDRLDRLSIQAAYEQHMARLREELGIDG